MSSLGTAPPDTGRVRKRAAYLQGFSLHAAVHLHENDREGLAHLCGYGARPPFSQERLSQLPDGRLVYRLKRPLSDGRTALLLEPGDLLRRLAMLVPPPRAHLLRYHGVFAPASRWRREVVPRPSPQSRTVTPPCPLASPRPRRPREVPAASLGPSCCCGFSARTCSPAPAVAAAWCSPI
jgi:Putative transposase